LQDFFLVSLPFEAEERQSLTSGTDGFDSTARSGLAIKE